MAIGYSLHLLVLCAIAYQTNAISFYVEPNMQKCLRDQAQAHQLIVMEFDVTEIPGQQIDYVVRILLYYYIYYYHYNQMSFYTNTAT